MAHPQILCAAVLHNTIEDTATTFQELERGFGLNAAGLVREHSDDTTQDKATRKRLVIKHAPDLSLRRSVDYQGVRVIPAYAGNSSRQGSRFKRDPGHPSCTGNGRIGPT